MTCHPYCRNACGGSIPGTGGVIAFMVDDMLEITDRTAAITATGSGYYPGVFASNIYGNGGNSGTGGLACTFGGTGGNPGMSGGAGKGGAGCTINGGGLIGSLGQCLMYNGNTYTSGSGGDGG